MASILATITNYTTQEIVQHLTPIAPFKSISKAEGHARARAVSYKRQWYPQDEVDITYELVDYDDFHI